MNEEFFEELREKVKGYFEENGSHDFSHSQRVHDMCVLISGTENVDIDIVRVSAILHDIARTNQSRDSSICHAEEGANMAADILKEGVFPEEKIEDVLYSIRSHRQSKGVTPKTKEAAILQDADRLDALGAITIARMFSSGVLKERKMHNPEIDSKKWENESYSGASSKTTIDGFYNKIFKIKPETFKTRKAQEIAKGRYDYVRAFVDRFEREWRGEL